MLNKINCFLGVLVLSSLGTTLSAHISDATTPESCIAGNWRHCDRLVEGLATENGAARIGRSVDIEAAIRVGREGCRVGQLDVCFRYAQILYRAESGQHTDRPSAENIFRQLCERNHERACDAVQRHGL